MTRVLSGAVLVALAVAVVWFAPPLIFLAVAEALVVLAFVTKHLQPDAEQDFIPAAAQRFVVAADAVAFYVSKVLVPFPADIAPEKVKALVSIEGLGPSPKALAERARYQVVGATG